MIREHARVVLTRDLPAEGLAAGDVGTIVHIYADGTAYVVEFLALDGSTAAVATVERDAVRAVATTDITHARVRASA